MTPETAVPVKEKKRTSAPAPSDTRHDWPRGHPRIDMINLDDRLIIKTEVPGVERDDIELRLEDRDLVIYEARHDENEVKDNELSRMEPAFGSILRRIPMPFGVTAGDVQANFNEGLLRVEVRRPACGQPNSREINVR